VRSGSRNKSSAGRGKDSVTNGSASRTLPPMQTFRSAVMAHRHLIILSMALAALLIIKFFWSYLLYDVPLGYDTGMYRYLFVQHAHGWPPFIVTDLEPWARGHPLGLFIFTSLFIHAGIPVDWLVGWVWNLFPVILACTLGFVIGRRQGPWTGVCVMLAAILSIAFYDGFTAMYWKTYASLFWCVLAFDAFERRRLWLAVPFGILTIVSHSQTGLLFAIVVAAWFLGQMFVIANPKLPITKFLTKGDLILIVGAGVLIGIVGIAIYLPVWRETISDQLPALLGAMETSSGSFPPAMFYVREEFILLLLGAYGFLRSVQKEQWTVWQLAVLCSLIFVALRLIFYRRFFLQLDFFMFPFAAFGIQDLWNRYRGQAERMALVIAIVVQFVMMQQVIVTRKPVVDSRTFASILKMSKNVPEDAFVLSLENESVMVMRGWMPYNKLGGPGLFDVDWSVQAWERFLLGTHNERVELLRALPRPVYVFVSPFFRDYYGADATKFLSDGCFKATEMEDVFIVVCVGPPKK
jgi:hypothetical protein